MKHFYKLTRCKKRTLIMSVVSAGMVALLFFPTLLRAETVNSVNTTVKPVQQTRKINGMIKDELGETLIGVSIVIRGTLTGTTTDMDGQFTLNVSPGDVLEISYIGYQKQSVTIGEQTSLEVTMAEDSQAIEEVVVVGFGTQKKANLTGSVANVDKKLLENRPITSVSAGLQGVLPGVTITQKSGQPGSDDGTIRIRGVGTFNNASPMVIVDGVESSMNNIDPNDIENISVLKDAASAAIYGSKAANGVILITTKRGKSGKARISYAANFGWQKPTQLPDLVGSADYAMLYNEASRNDGKPEIYTPEAIQKFRDGSDPYNYPNTDWQDLFYVGSGFQQSHNISLNGGADNIRYMISLGYQKQLGIIRNTNKDQYNFRVNVDANPTERLETSINFSYINTSLKEPTNPYVGGMEQIFRQVKRISPMVPYKYENGEYGSIGDGNPIAWMDMNATTDKKRHNMLASGSLKYALIDGLSVKGVASYKLYVEDSNEFRKDIQYNKNKYHGPNKMYQKDNFENTVYGDILLEYQKDFGLHNFNALAGFHAELFQKKYTYAYRENFANNEVGDINAGATAGMLSEGYTRELAMLSWLGRVNYNYAGKYLAEANIRYDGTSRFAKGNRWGAFPSVSAGWRISEEGFFMSAKRIVNNMKLRASWGMLGNQSVLDKDNVEWYYPTVPPFTLGKPYPFGGSIASGGALEAAVNPNLKWETTTTWGVGLDLTFINKIHVTVDYYEKKTSDILMVVPTPDTYALLNFIGNVGSVVNRGVEISAQYNNRFGEVEFNAGANFAYNKNEILDLGGVNEIITDEKIKRIGSPINSFYGYKTAGLYQSQKDIDEWPVYKITGQKVQPGDLRYVNSDDSDNELNTKDRVVLGSEEPDFTFGFNVGANYKGFDVMAFFQGAAGVKRYMNIEVVGEINGDDTRPSTFWLDRWTPENTNTDVPRVALASAGPSLPGRISDYWLQNASYLRMKNLQVGYTFTLTKLKISKLRVYYSGQNLLTFSSFLKGWDPESPSGRGGHYPQVIVNSFGLNLTF